MDYGMPTGEIRSCEGCGHDFDVLEGARNWRYCSTECWGDAQREHEHELVERGRQMERRHGQHATQAEVEAAEVRGYQRGHEEGWREGVEEGARKAAGAMEELARRIAGGHVAPQPVPDDDLPPW